MCRTPRSQMSNVRCQNINRVESVYLSYYNDNNNIIIFILYYCYIEWTSEMYFSTNRHLIKLLLYYYGLLFIIFHLTFLSGLVTC